MGKPTRRQKPKKFRKTNPIGIPSVKDLLLDENLLNSQCQTNGPIGAITEQIQSINNGDKLCGLQALSYYCQNQQNVSEIIDKDNCIVKVTGSLLMEKYPYIRNASAAALRNLSMCGIDICENLIDQDILTPLLALFNEYAGDNKWAPVIDPTMNNELDISSDTFLHAVHLLRNLCESHSLAVDIFNDTNIVASFVRCLDYTIYGMDIAITIGKCLLVVSEDNKPAWKTLKNFEDQFLIVLNDKSNVTSVEYSHQFLKTLVACIMLNIPELSVIYIPIIITTLATTIRIDHRQILGQFTSAIPLDYTENNNRDIPVLEVSDDFNMTNNNNVNGSRPNETDQAARLRRRQQDLPTEFDKQLKIIGYLLEAQRLSAESISNLCLTEDDMDDIGDDDDDDSNDERSNDMDDGTVATAAACKLPTEISQQITSLDIFGSLWKRAEPLPVNVSNLIREKLKDLSQKIPPLRTSCLICLQNLCNVLTIEYLSGPQELYQIWLNLGTQVFNGVQDTNIVEASTALMRSALSHLCKNSELFQNMSEDDLKLILNGVRCCDEPEIRANLLRMLGILCTCLSSSEHLIKNIIECLLDVCLNEKNVWIISEGVDSLMDIYADNDWDKMTYELQLLQTIRQLEKLMKIQLKQQRHELRERYAAVSTVKLNLINFIKYIEKQQKKYKPTINI